MTFEIKPCPFCGKAMEVSEKINFSYFAFSHMYDDNKSCPLSVRAYTKTKAQAKRQWNRRAEVKQD